MTDNNGTDEEGNVQPSAHGSQGNVQPSAHGSQGNAQPSAHGGLLSMAADSTEEATPPSQTTNTAGLQLIESFEGLRLNSYQDSVGVWTIGYGHTNGVRQGQTITQPQAEAFLQQDLDIAESAVNAKGLTLADNQFAALVSFTFNLGSGNLNKLLSRGLAAVPDRILLFDHAGGKALPGLTRRRRAERDLYLTL